MRFSSSSVLMMIDTVMVVKLPDLVAICAHGSRSWRGVLEGLKAGSSDPHKDNTKILSITRA
jgi:hypothetical protein